MWLAGILISYLSFAKLSTADLGLPISLLGLHESIRSLIQNARTNENPFNKTLQDHDAVTLTNLDYDFNRVRLQWQGAMVNLSRVQNYTLGNLTKALGDQSSGHRKVFDGLYGSIKNFKAQEVANRGLITKYCESKGGPRNIRILNETRTQLEAGLDGVRDALAVLDEVISKTQRTKPLTEENVLKGITPGMTTAVWTAVVKILGSMGMLDILARDSLVVFKLADQDANRTRNYLKKTINWNNLETMLNATEDVVDKMVNTSTTLVQKLNQTVWTGYRPLVKNKQMLGVDAINSFLTNFTRNMFALNFSVTDLSETFYGDMMLSVSWFEQSVQQVTDWALDSAAENIFQSENYSLALDCTQKCPLVNVTLAMAVKLTEICTTKELENFPNIAKTFEERLQPISAVALAPLSNFQTCISSKLDRSLCLRAFATTHLFEATGNNRTLTAAVARLMVQAHRLVVKEFAEIANRLRTCTMSNIGLDSLRELRRNREACHGKDAEIYF